jgi:hypothetical protein
MRFYSGSQDQLTLAWLLPRRTRILQVQKHVSEHGVDWKRADGAKWDELEDAKLFRIDVTACETLQYWLANNCSGRDPEGGLALVASLDLQRYWKLEPVTEEDIEHPALPSYHELRLITFEPIPESVATTGTDLLKRKACTADERVELLLQWLKVNHPTEKVVKDRGKPNRVRAAAETWLKQTCSCSEHQFQYAWQKLLKQLQPTKS